MPHRGLFSAMKTQFSNRQATGKSTVSRQRVA
jgi:hypothetical protein